MPNLILYQRDDCQLCDEALALLAQARVPEFESVFIDDDDVLEARYGERVPVLRDAASGVELDWPFDADQLRAWLGPVNAPGCSVTCPDSVNRPWARRSGL